MKAKRDNTKSKHTGNFFRIPVPIMDSDTFNYALDGLLRSFRAQTDKEWIAAHLRTLAGPDNLQMWRPR
jgi:hypothetical protein